MPDQWTYQEWKEWQDPLMAGDPDKGKRITVPERGEITVNFTLGR